MQYQSFQLNQEHVHVQFMHDWKYRHLAAQDELSEERIAFLKKKAYNGNEAEVELKSLLKKSLVIGGDTGKRSTFTLSYNFALQCESEQEWRRQKDSILNFKYGTHKSLKYKIKNFEFGDTIRKHFERKIQNQFFQHKERRSIYPERHEQYQQERNRQRQEL